MRKLSSFKNNKTNKQLLSLTRDCLMEAAGWSDEVGSQLSQNHRMAWIEKDYNDHLVSTPLLFAGSPATYS